MFVWSLREVNMNECDEYERRHLYSYDGGDAVVEIRLSACVLTILVTLATVCVHTSILNLLAVYLLFYSAVAVFCGVNSRYFHEYPLIS